MFKLCWLPNQVPVPITVAYLFISWNCSNLCLLWLKNQHKKTQINRWKQQFENSTGRFHLVVMATECKYLSITAIIPGEARGRMIRMISAAIREANIRNYLLLTKKNTKWIWQATVTVRSETATVTNSFLTNHLPFIFVGVFEPIPADVRRRQGSP